MKAKELADLLDGREYGEEISEAEEARAKDAGLVVVYGYSDDCVELRGAVDEELGAWNGTTIHINADGIVCDPGYGCIWEDCELVRRALKTARSIKAVWHNSGGPCWTYETDIPHETFKIFEGGELYCEGIVFDMRDVSPEEGK